MSNDHQPSWGLLPYDVYKMVYKREWSSISLIKKRLSGSKEFPIKIGLKPPTGKDALSNYSHLETFLNQWLEFKHQELLVREMRNYRNVGQQHIPTFLVIDSTKSLAKYLGKEAQEKLIDWEMKMRPILELNSAFATVCIEQLGTIDSMTQAECNTMANLIPQLKPGMGKGLYLRALPVTQVHTKFIETYIGFITRCLDIITGNGVSHAGGLIRWLGCIPKPVGWIFVRPLCSKVRESLGNVPIFKMSQNDLHNFDFPCKNIIVIENETTGLSLPDISETIAVFGGGANVSWLSSEHISNKQIIYWGDIDSYGFKYLSDARLLCPHIRSIMMDEATILAFENHMTEDNYYDGEMPGLTDKELSVCMAMRNKMYTNTRLEQEFISQDFMINTINNTFLLN